MRAQVDINTRARPPFFVLQLCSSEVEDFFFNHFSDLLRPLPSFNIDCWDNVIYFAYVWFSNYVVCHLRLDQMIIHSFLDI